MTGAWLLANDLKQISDCTGGRETMQFDTASQNKWLVYEMDLDKIRLALQSLKEERAHIEEYLQNAAAKKKELDKERNASFGRYIKMSKE